MKKILIVDDEPVILEMISIFLKRSGYEVMTTNNASDAIKRIIENEIDILLTDVMMPGISGFELSEKVNHVFPEIKIILMTGYDLQRKSPFPVLHKPFKNNELEIMLKEDKIEIFK